MKGIGEKKETALSSALGGEDTPERRISGDCRSGGARGLHNPRPDGMEDRFSLHCCGHWMTAYLR